MGKGERMYYRKLGRRVAAPISRRRDRAARGQPGIGIGIGPLGIEIGIGIGPL